MEISNFTTTILKASEGYKLTQSNDIDIKERILASTIALGKYDSQDNWKEVTDEEAEALRKEQDEAIRKENEQQEVD